MEFGLATSFGEGVMDTGDCCSDGFSCSVLDGAHEDAVTVIVIGYEEVVVAGAGRVWESSSLVSVH